MINVLTIEREYGSGANDIARIVSERLGWKLWDQAMTEEIARFLECDHQQVERHEERADPLYYRLFKGFLRGSFEGSPSTPRMKPTDAEAIRAATEQIVRRVAKEGNCVIVGRGSAYYLHDSPGVFHVFIYAPFEEKVRRLEHAGHGEQEAIQLAETVDQDRAAFIKQRFGIEWPRREYFDLMVNSAMGDESAAEAAIDAMKVIDKAGA